MLTLIPRLYNDIIDVIFEAFMDYLVKNGGHCTLVSDSCGREAKRHGPIVKIAKGVQKTIFLES